jgi:hypothetical protein
MSELLDKQQRFAGYLGILICFCYSKGWRLTMAEGYVGDSINRPEEDTPHLRRGSHFKRLGQDLNLFVDGTWITEGGHSAWLALGEFWESLDESCRWGGRFGDANHFSIEHDGVK